MSDEEIKKAKYKSLIDSYFIDDPKYSRYSFKGMMENTISSIVERFFHIIVYYFDKYSEQEFHRRMKNQYILIDKKTKEQFVLDGFDFISDFKTFHKAKYLTSMMAVRMNKNWFVFDEPRMTKILIGLLETKGWKIYDHEKESIKQTVKRFRNIIYFGRDTVKDLN